jgi:hypothetical protein
MYSTNAEGKYIKLKKGYHSMLLLTESPRYLMHRSRVLDAYRVWKRIRGVESFDSQAEFYLIKVTADAEERELRAKRAAVKFIWLDFIT